MAERPDLVEAAWLATNDLIPEYNNHGDTLDEYWPRLTEELPEYQFHLLDEDEQILARARSIPVRWDGTTEDLPHGIDGALARGFDEGQPNALCALLVAVPGVVQQRGVSASALAAMSDIARRHGFGSLIAPVRPSARSVTHSYRSSAMQRGDDQAVRCSIRGCEFTNDSGPVCSNLRRSRCGSRRR